jgi:hypothetical protein
VREVDYSISSGKKLYFGVLAQLVERDNGIVEVMGSTPLHSTKGLKKFRRESVLDGIERPYFMDWITDAGARTTPPGLLVVIRG